MPDQSSPNPEVSAGMTEEEKEKIERMNRIRKTMAKNGEGGSDLPKPGKNAKSRTQSLDVSVADNPPPVQGSEATRAQKVAQIREALAMVERPSAPSQQPVKKGTLPPLKKKGTKSTAAKKAAAETVVTPHRPAVKTPPPVQQKTKSAAKPPAPAPRKLAPLKRADLNTPNPASAAIPVQKTSAPSVSRQPLPPLKKAGTKGSAAQNAAATVVARPVKGEAAPHMKPAAPKSNTVPKPAKNSIPKTAAAPQESGSIGKISAILGGSAAGALVIAYVIMAFVYNGKFLPNTYINDVSISGMTMEEAETELLNHVKADDLILVTPDGEDVTFAAAEYDAVYSLPEGALDDAFSENRFLWIKKLFSESAYTIEYDFNYSEENLRSLITSYGWGTEAAQNAYIQKTADGMYEIVPATIGDKFDKNKLMDYVTEQLTVGKTMVNMQESGCYDAFAAEVQAEDLQQKLELCNKFADCTITFDFSDRTEILDGETIASWVIFTDAGELTFNRSEVETFVANMAAKTDTYGTPRTFRSTLDGVITVPWTSTSIYGWQINQEATVDQIFELLQTGESATVEPVYQDWGYGYTRNTDDIGTTYVEVDISAQHVWYYKGGVLQMESDCVTGTETVDSRRTPRGVFKIWSHESPRVLGQMEDEGYETWVKYWMPVNYIGVGLHDLGRSAYGGNIYMYNGSHGCINLPMSFVEDLYYATENGIPVIIHD